MKEHRIESEGPLHRGDGRLAEPGYASSLLLKYNKLRVKAPNWRVKEWDYYLISDEDYAVALTLGDLGYMGLVSASVIDLQQARYKTSSVITPFPMGSFGLPVSSDKGISEYSNSRVNFRFEVENGERKIRARFDKFEDGEPLNVEAVLDREPTDSMVIATPWKEDPLAFYYNQKIVGMRAQGSFKKGMLVHGFRPEDSFGLLDWGRGVWTRDNTWFWAVAQGWQDGKGLRTIGSHVFCLNLGYGFGDTSAATENMIFVDGHMHKLSQVKFDIPMRVASEDDTDSKEPGIGAQYELMEPWRIRDDEGKLDLVFTPTVDRVDYRNLKVIISDQHQVFGTFSGQVKLDEKVFLIRDLSGSAELVRNKY